MSRTQAGGVHAEEVRRLHAAGLNVNQIRRQLGLAYTTVQLIVDRTIVNGPAAKLQTRACLGCGDPFRSEGKHNRVCTPCKKSEAWHGIGDDRAGVRAAQAPARPGQ